MERFDSKGGRVADFPAPEETPFTPHFSLADALEVVEGDPVLLQEMTRAFLRYAPVLLENLRSGFEGGDAFEIAGNLRELRERSASVGASALGEEACLLGAAFEEGGPPSPSSVLDRLEDLLEAFRSTIEQLDWEDLDDGF